MGLHIKRKIKHIGHSAKKTVKKTGKNIKNAVKHPVKSIKKCAKKVFNGLGRALSYTSGIVLNPLFSVGALLASKQLANNQIISLPILQNISIFNPQSRIIQPNDIPSNLILGDPSQVQSIQSPTGTLTPDIQNLDVSTNFGYA